MTLKWAHLPNTNALHLPLPKENTLNLSTGNATRPGVSDTILMTYDLDLWGWPRWPMWPLTLDHDRWPWTLPVMWSNKTWNHIFDLVTFDLNLQGEPLTLAHVMWPLTLNRVALEPKDFLWNGQMRPEITFLDLVTFDLDPKGQSWGHPHQCPDRISWP